MAGLRARGIQSSNANQNVPQLPMGNKLTRSTSHHNTNYLVHSASSNDTSLGEYKYTVNVGNRSVKITGDSLELVRVSRSVLKFEFFFFTYQIDLQTAKFVLDDFFGNDQFLKSNEAALLNSEIGQQMIPISHQIPSQPSPFIDSGINLDLLACSSALGSNVMSHQLANEFDDEVFMHSESPVEANVLTSSSSIESSSSSNTVVTDQQSLSNSNGLSRSRRSHFSRKDSTPENAKPKSDSKMPNIKLMRYIYY